MIPGNQSSRVEFPLSLVKGPLPGERLLHVFKEEIAKERVFQLMFGDHGERIFVSEEPNLNETILPAIILNWGSETFMSNDTTIEGTVSGYIVMPVRLKGDTNSLRRVGSIVQRWMSGSMSLFDKVPGLTKFGFNAQFNFQNLAALDGFKAPVIEITLPYRFDLQLMRLESIFDPNAPLDDADVGFVEQYILEVIDGETKESLEGVVIETGQVNQV